MLNILDKDYKLNQIICVGYLNSRGYYEVVSGRIFDYDKNNIWIDMSYDFWQLEDTLKIKKDNIKYIKRTDSDLWR